LTARPFSGFVIVFFAVKAVAISGAGELPARFVGTEGVKILGISYVGVKAVKGAAGNMLQAPVADVTITLPR